MYHGNFEHAREGVGTFLKLRMILKRSTNPRFEEKSPMPKIPTQSELHPCKLHTFDVELFRGMLASITGRVHFYFLHTI